MTDIKSMNLAEMTAFLKALGGTGFPGQTDFSVAPPGG